MHKVYQTVIDPNKGNCMQAVIASLFEVQLEDVPNFIEYKEGWFRILWDFIESKNYEYKGFLYNNSDFINLKHKQDLNSVREDFRFEQIKNYEGVNGYFFASVFSPRFYKYEDQIPNTHAVIIDKDFNIVHDPNPNYANLESYPEADKLGYNGILDIFIIEPNNE